jgi:LysR family nitrogen assimilation transcriptional regulator
MDLRQLKYFAKIVEQRSMSRASVELHVAQSALSLQISNLETRLQQKLLIRRSTGVFPTKAGQTLYNHAVAILRQVERATRDVELSASEVSGFASLGLPVVVQDLLAIDLLAAAREQLPSVRLHLAEGMSYLLKEMVLQGRLDMTVTYQFEPSPGILEHPLFNESIYLVSPPNLKPTGGSQPASLSDIAKYPLVLSSRQTGMRRLVEAAFAKQGVSPEPIAEIDSLRTLVDVVEAGYAHTMLPASALQRHFRRRPADGVVVHPLDLSRNVVLCTSEHLPLGVAATAVNELLESVIHRALDENRWEGIRRISCAPST